MYDAVTVVLPRVEAFRKDVVNKRISPKESLWAMFKNLRDRVQEEIGHLEAAEIPAAM